MAVSLMLSGNAELDSRKIADIGSQAEKKGFEGLWFGETTQRDASILATSAACATKKIQLGTSIVNVFTRTPGQLAMMGSTINELSGGRFTLGLGVSTNAIVEGWHGIPFRTPIARLDETVHIIRQYYSGEKFNYEGQFHSPHNSRLKTKFPTKIALAALNDQMIRKAALLADRIVLNLHPPERIPHARSIIDETCKTANRTKRPVLSVMLYASLIDEDENGVDAAKDLISFYASAPAYATLYSNLGFQAEARTMTEAWTRKDRESVRNAVSREMIDRLMVLGSVEDLVRRVERYRNDGIDDVFVAPSPFGKYETNLNIILNTYSPS